MEQAIQHGADVIIRDWVRLRAGERSGAQLIDKDNYQILVDNGTYTEDEIAPDSTPTPEATPVPKVTLKTASEEDSKEVTPTPETEDKSEGETRENLIYDSEDNSKVEKTSDQKK